MENDTQSRIPVDSTEENVQAAGDFSKDNNTGIASVSLMVKCLIDLFVIYLLESIQVCLHSRPALLSTLLSLFLEPFLGSSVFGEVASSVLFYSWGKI